jgi:isopenicillin N synthase-like dioxygenase
MSAAAASPIPVIDLAPFHERGVAGKRAVAAQVDAACRDLGFLQVTGHGVPAPEPGPGQMRMGAHTDYGILTVLLADDVPGLQVFWAGGWQDTPTPPGTLTLNIGDMLALWTNDRWTSTLHRVLPPPAAARGLVRRRSVARFLDCEPDQVIECIPSCCGPGNPPKYQPVQAGEWLMAKILHGRQAPGATRDGAGRQGS